MAAVKIPILEEKMHGKHKYCSYLLAYFHAKGLKAGGTWIAYEHQEWIEEKHEEFRKLIHSPCCLGYNEKERAMFEKFITKEKSIA